VALERTEWNRPRQWKSITDMRIATWNVRTGAVNELAWRLRNLWPRKGSMIKKNYMILYRDHKSDKHEYGTGLYTTRHIMDNLLYFEPINERICKIRAKLHYYNLTLLSTNAPPEDKDEVAEE